MITRLLSSGWRRLTACFVAGILAVLPFVLTVAIVIWVASFLQNHLGPDTVPGKLLSAVGLRFGSEAGVAYLFGWLLVLLAVFGLGILVELGAKRLYHRFVDSMFRRVPIVGSLYGSLKQLVNLFDQAGEAELKAMSVVYCSFGSPDGPGVLALMPSPEVITLEGRRFHVVIIPTAPIPFGGALLFVPVDCIRPLTMSVDSFMSIYVSMGVTTPEFMCTPSAPPA